MGSLESFSKQIRAIAAEVRAVSPSIRIVSQVAVRLSCRKGEDTFAVVRTAILRWMARRSGRKFPDHAWYGKSFLLEEIGAQYTAAVGLDEPKYWAARLDDADKTVAQRSWITEIGLAQPSAGVLLLGTRLQCVTRGGDEPFVPSVPAFVRRVADVAHMYLDGRPVDGEIWLVANEDDVEQFVEFLSSPKRRHDVVVFSLPPESTDPKDTIIPLDPFAKATLGAAHTVVLTGPAGYALTDRVGKEFSVFLQAVRTYRPGLKFGDDQPFAHPLALATRIRGWDDEIESFEQHLIRQTLQNTVTARDLEKDLPPFALIRGHSDDAEREKAKESGAEDRKLLELADGDIERLKKDLTGQKEEYDALLEQAQKEIDAAKAQRDQLQQQYRSLRSRVEYLERRPAFQRSEEPLPDNFDDLAEWADRNLAGAIFIHNRAIRAAKKSEFHDVGFAYKALILLRDFYVPMKRQGGNELQEAFREACAALGLEDSLTFAGARYGEQGDEYFVPYAGRKRLLKKHLKGSNVRDPRYGFRLYYFWDHDEEQVIVGWLPSHLSTRIS